MSAITSMSRPSVQSTRLNWVPANGCWRDSSEFIMSIIPSGKSASSMTR